MCEMWYAVLEDKDVLLLLLVGLVGNIFVGLAYASWANVHEQEEFFFLVYCIINV